MRTLFKNIGWGTALSTALPLLFKPVWAKLRWVLDAVGVVKLPADLGDIFGGSAMTPTILSGFIVVIGVAGLYLTNREFWHILFGKLRAATNTRQKVSAPLIGMLAAGLVFVVCFVWYFLTDGPKASAIFIASAQATNIDTKDAFELPDYLLKQLGPAQSVVHLSKGNAQFVHEKSIVIWRRRDKEIIVINYATGKWMSVTEANSPDDPRYWTNEYFTTKEVFSNIPSGLFPPHAGIAKLWEENPKKWSKELGWRKWHCALPDLYFQQFENGSVVGPIIDSPTSLGHGIVLILFSDKTWKTWTVSKPQKLHPVTDQDGRTVE